MGEGGEVVEVAGRATSEPRGDLNCPIVAFPDDPAKHYGRRKLVAA